MPMIDVLPDEPFRTCDAHAVGVSSQALTRLVRDGFLNRWLRGVYVKADMPNTLENRCAAARLVVNPTAVVCDRTAAWILGVDVLDYDELESLPPLETYVLRGRNRTRRSECNGGVRDLRRDDWVGIGGLRVTTPLRTALDLACKLRRRDALAALDAFMKKFELTTAQLRKELQRYFRRRGVVQARELIELADPRSESPGESWARLEVHDRGLPAPRPQVWVYCDGREFYRLDLAWRRRKVALEYDGRDFHGQDRTEHDLARRKWLETQGWRVIVVRAEDFAPERLDAWLGELRDALE